MVSGDYKKNSSTVSILQTATRCCHTPSESRRVVDVVVRYEQVVLYRFKICNGAYQ